MAARSLGASNDAVLEFAAARGLTSTQAIIDAWLSENESPVPVGAPEPMLESDESDPFADPGTYMLVRREAAVALDSGISADADRLLSAVPAKAMPRSGTPESPLAGATVTDSPPTMNDDDVLGLSKRVSTEVTEVLLQELMQSSKETQAQAEAARIALAKEAMASAESEEERRAISEKTGVKPTVTMGTYSHKKKKKKRGAPREAPAADIDEARVQATLFQRLKNIFGDKMPSGETVDAFTQRLSFALNSLYPRIREMWIRVAPYIQVATARTIEVVGPIAQRAGQYALKAGGAVLSYFMTTLVPMITDLVLKVVGQLVEVAISAVITAIIDAIKTALIANKYGGSVTLEERRTITIYASFEETYADPAYHRAESGRSDAFFDNGIISFDPTDESECASMRLARESFEHVSSYMTPEAFDRHFLSGIARQAYWQNHGVDITEPNDDILFVGDLQGALSEAQTRSAQAIEDTLEAQIRKRRAAFEEDAGSGATDEEWDEVEPGQGDEDGTAPPTRPAPPPPRRTPDTFDTADDEEDEEDDLPEPPLPPRVPPIPPRPTAAVLESAAEKAADQLEEAGVTPEAARNAPPPAPPRPPINVRVPTPKAGKAITPDPTPQRTAAEDAAIKLLTDALQRDAARLPASAMTTPAIVKFGGVDADLERLWTRATGVLKWYMTPKLVAEADGPTNDYYSATGEPAVVRALDTLTNGPFPDDDGQTAAMVNKALEYRNDMRSVELRTDAQAELASRAPGAAVDVAVPAIRAAAKQSIVDRMIEETTTAALEAAKESILSQEAPDLTKFVPSADEQKAAFRTFQGEIRNNVLATLVTALPPEVRRVVSNEEIEAGVNSVVNNESAIKAMIRVVSDPVQLTVKRARTLDENPNVLSVMQIFVKQVANSLTGNNAKKAAKLAGGKLTTTAATFSKAGFGAAKAAGSLLSRTLAGVLKSEGAAELKKAAGETLGSVAKAAADAGTQVATQATEAAVTSATASIKEAARTKTEEEKQAMRDKREADAKARREREAAKKETDAKRKEEQAKKKAEAAEKKKETDAKKKEELAKKKAAEAAKKKAADAAKKEAAAKKKAKNVGDELTLQEEHLLRVMEGGTGVLDMLDNIYEGPTIESALDGVEEGMFIARSLPSDFERPFPVAADEAYSQGRDRSVLRRRITERRRPMPEQAEAKGHDNDKPKGGRRARGEPSERADRGERKWWQWRKVAQPYETVGNEVAEAFNDPKFMAMISGERGSYFSKSGMFRVYNVSGQPMADLLAVSALYHTDPVARDMFPVSAIFGLGGLGKRGTGAGVLGEYVDMATKREETREDWERDGRNAAGLLVDSFEEEGEERQQQMAGFSLYLMLAIMDRVGRLAPKGVRFGDSARFPLFGDVRDLYDLIVRAATITHQGILAASAASAVDISSASRQAALLEQLKEGTASTTSATYSGDKFTQWEHELYIGGKAPHTLLNVGALNLSSLTRQLRGAASKAAGKADAKVREEAGVDGDDDAGKDAEPTEREKMILDIAKQIAEYAKRQERLKDASLASEYSKRFIQEAVDDEFLSEEIGDVTRLQALATFAAYFVIGLLAREEVSHAVVHYIRRRIQSPALYVERGVYDNFFGTFNDSLRSAPPVRAKLPIIMHPADVLSVGARVVSRMHETGLVGHASDMILVTSADPREMHRLAANPSMVPERLLVKAPGTGAHEYIDMHGTRFSVTENVGGAFKVSKLHKDGIQTAVPTGEGKMVGASVIETHDDREIGLALLTL